MGNRPTDPLTRLKQLIVQQKTAALPDRPPDPSLQALHVVVVAYDRHVSETVIGVLGGGDQAGPFPEQEKLRREMEA